MIRLSAVRGPVAFRVLFCLLLLAGTIVTPWTFAAAPKRPAKPQPNLPDLKTPEDKMKFLEMIRASFPVLRAGRNVSFDSEDLDRDLERQIAKGTSTPFAEIIDDETFIRRASIDATGEVPSAKQVRAFVADKNPKKRAALVDELLASDAFARKWARYWRNVIFYESNANRNMINPQALEDFFFEEFKAGTSWDRIVGELMSSSPARDRNKKPEDNGWNQDYGPNNFILACENKPELIASNTARLFMGISIGCAECHDHPFDSWKREQFHELAAFYSSGKYYMTDQNDPSQKTEMTPKFLLGETPPAKLKPDQRRVAGAAYLIYNPDNYWFARAYVNRIWSELVGDGFYSVDSLGPDKEVQHVLTINRLAAAFRYSGFDIRGLFRVLMNSRTYQRGIATLSHPEDLFTAVRPSRLRPYEVADNVERLTGSLGGLRKSMESTFDANPSIPQSDLEGSIQQALLLMNNPTISGKLANSSLKKDLVNIKDDKAMISEAFLGILARTPTPQESVRYEYFMKDVTNRNEAIDDLMWVLVNSAEFCTKR
ncbi:MAG: DUF1549 domain-containing protein [Planctomycetaceae bacterium]|nr:DUF1549 domain-containing protein [Planctomycetaceae bacterium]